MSTTDTLIRTLEAADHQAHHARADRGRWLLPVLRSCTSAAVLVARKLERTQG